MGSGVPGLVAKEYGKLADYTFNFANIAAGTSLLGANDASQNTVMTSASGDTYKFPVPLNAEVQVYYQVVTANTDGGGARTVSIGDSANSSTYWVSALDMTTAGNLTKSSGGPYLYAAAADNVIVLNNEALSSGSLRVVVYAKII
jgi:hypothetical protein